MTDLAVVVFAVDVVFDEHHLCSHLQCEVEGGGVGIFGKCSVNLCLIGERL